MDMARTFEATEAHLQQFQGPGEISVHESRKYSHKQSNKSNNRSRSQSRNRNSYKKRSHCLNCGFSHARGQCPARNSVCNKCGRMGHWGKVCLNPHDRKSPRRHGNKNISAVDQATEVSDEFEKLTFASININIDSHANDNERTEAYAIIKIEPYVGRTTNLKGKVDTGAAGNILPMRTFKQIFPKRISSEGLPLCTKPSHAKLTDYNGHQIEQYGTITMSCQYLNSKHEETFYIANVNGPVIFGLPTCTRLGLVQMQCEITTGKAPKKITTLEDLTQRYPKQFNGIGNFKKSYHLTLEDNATR